MVEDFKYIEGCADRVFGKGNRLYLMGLSMIWIVLFHVSFWYKVGGLGEPVWWIKVFAEGQLGVDIFLFLSSYGLAASFEKNPLWQFYRNRVRRLFPVYFLFLFILFLVFDRDCTTGMIFLQGLYQITGISLIKYSDFFSTGFCFDWFTPAIIAIYIFFPIISFVVRFVQRKGFIFELLLLVVVVIIGNWIHMHKHFPLSLLAYRLPIILLGVMTYRHLKDSNVYYVLTLYVCAALLGFLCNEKAIILSLVIPSLLTVYSMTRFELPFKGIVSFVGHYSYEVYLGHIYIVAFFFPWGYVTDIFLLLVITVGGTLFFSSLLVIFQAYFYKLFRR